MSETTLNRRELFKCIKYLGAEAEKKLNMTNDTHSLAEAIAYKESANYLKKTLKEKEKEKALVGLDLGINDYIAGKEEKRKRVRV